MVVWAGGAGRGQQADHRGTRTLSEVMDVVAILAVVMISQVYTCVKTNQGVHFKCAVYCMSIRPHKAVPKEQLEPRQHIYQSKALYNFKICRGEYQEDER